MSAVDASGPLLAAGRDADIIEYAPGLVLRRSRLGRSQAAEARTMEYARDQGYPVPAIDSISDDGHDLVMERIEGLPMVDAIARRPWAALAMADQLADLHIRLHRITAPDWLPVAPGPVGDRLLHLDLHPINVIMSPSGPVVIDWPNAARGDGMFDVALTWLLMGAGTIPGGRAKASALGLGRSVVVGRFLRNFDRSELGTRLHQAAEWKCADPNIDDDERAGIRRIVDRFGG